MTLAANLVDREMQKFVEDQDGNPAVRFQSSQVPQLSSSNSTTTALAGNGTFNNGSTDGWQDVSAFTSVVVACKADQDGSLYMEFSNTGSGSADSTLTFNITANTNEVHRLTITRQYYRTRYLNGSVAQSSFEITTLIGNHTFISAPLNLPLQQDADSIPVRSIDSEIDIAEGKRTGYSIVNKFGENTAVSTIEDVWDGGGVYTGFPTGSAELVTVVSSDAGDDSDFKVTIYGLDANGDLQNEEITLNGTSLVDSANTYTRVFRGVITQSGSSNAEFTAGTISCAHKTTTANIFFVMPAGVNQTRVACYTIPSGYTGYLRSFDVEMSKAGGATTATGGLWVRNNGKPPRIINNFTISASGPYSPKIFGGLIMTELTDIAVRILTVSSGSISVTSNFDIILVKN